MHFFLENEKSSRLQNRNYVMFYQTCDQIYESSFLKRNFVMNWSVFQGGREFVVPLVGYFGGQYSDAILERYLRYVLLNVISIS